MMHIKQSDIIVAVGSKVYNDPGGDYCWVTIISLHDFLYSASTHRLVNKAAERLGDWHPGVGFRIPMPYEQI